MATPRVPSLERPGCAWCETAVGAAALRRVTAVLDAAEPSHARTVHVEAPNGAAVAVAERIACEASARGFAVVRPNATNAVATARRVRGRSVVLVSADAGEDAGEETGRAAVAAVRVACSAARIAAVVHVSVRGGADMPFRNGGGSSVAADTAAPPVERRALLHPVELFERRRFAHGERALRRRVYLAGAGRADPAARVAGALMLAERERHRGKPGVALSVLEHARRTLVHLAGADAALDVAAAIGCVRIDVGRLESARHLLESTWAVSLLAAPGGYPPVGVMLARCCLWQGDLDRAAEVLAATPTERPADDMTFARWCALRARVRLARHDLGGALRAIRDAQGTRRWHSPAAQAYLAADAAIVQAAIGEPRGALDQVTDGLAKAAEAHSLLLAARLRAALVHAHAQIDLGRQGMAAARWLHARRARLPAVVRWRAEWALGGLRRAGTSVAVRMPGRGENLVMPRWLRPEGRSDVVDEVVEVLRICQDADDERQALDRVCALLKGRLQAVAVGVEDHEGTPLAQAGGGRVTFALGSRAVSSGAPMPPLDLESALEAAVPVQYGGLAVAALCARWCRGDQPDRGRAVAVMTAAAAATAPAVRALLDRRSSSMSEGDDDLGLVGGSRAISELRQRVRQAARVPFPVLIEGESGSGKELVARALHHVGQRRQRRFCAINCAALTDELFEAELFGHARGAFTGAVAERPGVFEEADGGTLFLDEVTELSPRAQAKLLRVLQEGEVRRVGENVARRVDVRVIAATNRSLSDAVARGGFRDDLRYRLDVVRIVVPPLRERLDDIAPLVVHFWQHASARTGSRASLDPAVIAALARHRWPGNVRELQNVIALLAVSAPRRGRVTLALLAASAGLSAEPSAERPVRLAAARRSFEEAFVREALARNGGRRTTTARELGLTRQGLTKLLTRLGLDEAGARQGSAAAAASRRARGWVSRSGGGRPEAALEVE